MENNDFKKVLIKDCTCYYFDDIIKLEDFKFDNILIDEKSRENILIYDTSYKTLFAQNLCVLDSIKKIGFIRIYDGTRYLVLLDPQEYDALYSRIRYLKMWHFFSLLYKNQI